MTVRYFFESTESKLRERSVIMNKSSAPKDMGRKGEQGGGQRKTMSGNSTAKRRGGNTIIGGSER